MRFKDVFSIIGPPMVGPSSSHTAGAARLGRVARKLFGRQPEQADIVLYGSFAATGQGHGTDLALAGGLLDYETDDPRIRNALLIAERSGIKIAFSHSQAAAAHPNTVTLTLRAQGEELSVTGASIGGGNIRIDAVNGFDLNFTGMLPTLLITHCDRPGVIAGVSRILEREQLNIGYIDVDRQGRSGTAMMVVETDSPVPDKIAVEIAALPDIIAVKTMDPTEGKAP
jgi:L-serine dehydratase